MQIKPRNNASCFIVVSLTSDKSNNIQRHSTDKRGGSGVTSRMSLIFLTLLALATQVSGKDAPEFALSASDKEMAKSVPLVYTANAFGCGGGNLSPRIALARRTSRHLEFRLDALRSR